MNNRIKIISIFILIDIFVLENNKFENNDRSKEKYTSRIPIFTFHRLVPDDIKNIYYKGEEFVGSIKIFEEMIKYLYDNGYKTLSSNELYKWYIGESEFTKKTVMITIDDGHYEDYYLVYPIIKKYNFKAISFVIGSKINNKTASYNKYTDSYIGIDVINKVREEYPFFEFQSHSFNMHYFLMDKGKIIRKIFNMSLDDLENDILLNDKYNFTSMSYPYGQFNEEIQEILENKGYLIAFRFEYYKNYATRNDNMFAIPRIKLNGFAKINNLKKWLRGI